MSPAGRRAVISLRGVIEQFLPEGKQQGENNTTESEENTFLFTKQKRPQMERRCQ